MIKFTQGSITNPETGVTKDIIVKAASPNTIKDLFIGVGIVAIGITYLTVGAFKKGADSMDKAELKTLSDCGLLK